MQDSAKVLERLKQLRQPPADSVVKGINIDPDAAALVQDLDAYPHTFVLACISDRRILTNRAWELPWRLGQRVGGFEVERLRSLSPEEWSVAVTDPTPLHPLPPTMAENFRLAIELICDRYDGDAARIWNDGCNSRTAVLRFQEFRGVGFKISNVAVNILVRDFGVELADRSALDVAPDVHVQRVFGRMGLVAPDASLEDVAKRARQLSPEWPGMLDWPVWEIGATWCHAASPSCDACPLSSVCPSAGTLS
ncbi:iron-sulfur cluster loop [Candidatus Palauibacter sp.]|uniref:iron-sulfur cluster loop n=1 Tax=Candidatus Palauibacter sp. TaxID=3101350 RepID=UPI003B5C9A8A